MTRCADSTYQQAVEQEYRRQAGVRANLLSVFQAGPDDFLAHLKSVLPAHVVEQDLRSPAALTVSLLGLIAEEAVIEKRLRYKLSKRRARA